MPYKTGKMKGELTTPEIRKLIKAHNVLVSIKIPKGAKREDIMKLIEKNGYKVDHEKQALIPKVEMKRRPKVDMKKADAVLPKPKTKEEKAVAKKERDKKKKEKEDKIKAEGVKQGAALQRVISTKKRKKEKEKDRVYSPEEIKDVFVDIMEEYEDYKKQIILEKTGEEKKVEKRILSMVKTIIKNIKDENTNFTPQQKPVLKKALNYYVRTNVDLKFLDEEDDPVIKKYGKIAVNLRNKYK